MSTEHVPQYMMTCCGSDGGGREGCTCAGCAKSRRDGKSSFFKVSEETILNLEIICLEDETPADQTDISCILPRRV